ncbi:uncharacterized protein EDB91DRAFT_486684 [Suillus paluster]|uniref:uncharacterized protein n=1 Tax=Suillus paluster TaxID=48578 RepID=UPI001B85C7C5|nr:uncharacterized protein EDB91DRAFT_486684 [Suillus paluster]KAG1719149.1 hypothetical protein EDB91DRAFT_486684 [Suillus paluster]
MARTRVGGKRKGPRDPTKEARIQAAIQDTLTGVHGSFRSAAIAHNVPPQTVRDRAAGKHHTRRSFLNKKKLDEEARIARIHNSITMRTFDSPFTSYKRKEDLEALAGALGLSRDGKIADLAARIKAHLEDPDTRTALADNPRFSVLYGSKRRTGRPVAVAVANPTSNENSTPSASTPLPTAANNMFYPQPPFFPQMQGSLPIPYPNHLHHVGPAVLSTTAPVISTSSQPLLSGHPNSLPFHYSGNSQYIFN